MSPDSRERVRAPTLRLSDIPDEPLVLVLQQLDTIGTLKMVTALVCKSWCVGHLRPHVWYALAVHHSVRLTISSRITLRSTVDPRKAFFLAVVRKEKVTAMHADAMISSLWTEMRKGEVTKGKLRKLASSAAFNVNHGLAMHSGWTAAFIASWYGRIRTLKDLVTTHGASLATQDYNKFTPLSVAAWAGQAEAVEWILQSGYDFGDFFQLGVPPMTSSCGGRGPYAPWVWALRKQHWGVLERMSKFIAGAKKGRQQVQTKRRRKHGGERHVERAGSAAEQPTEDGGMKSEQDCVGAEGEGEGLQERNLMLRYFSKALLAWDLHHLTRWLRGDGEVKRRGQQRHDEPQTNDLETEMKTNGAVLQSVSAAEGSGTGKVVVTVYQGGLKGVVEQPLSPLQVTVIPSVTMRAAREGGVASPTLELYIGGDHVCEARSRVEQVLLRLVHCQQEDYAANPDGSLPRRSVVNMI